MGMIDNDWLPALKPEFAKTYYKDLFEFVMSTAELLYIHRQMIYSMRFILPHCQK